jgi:lactobin A/cerein 7B family class IIb bacteriocin
MSNSSDGRSALAWMEKIMSKADRGTKIMDAQQTREVRELTAAELDSVNGGRGSIGSILLAAAGAVVDAVFDGVVVPIIRAV